jgi:phosphoribosylaminoimidazole-succinocarboxamide synthase
MTDEVVAGITARYIELYEGITGEKLVLEVETEDIAARIENNVNNYLNK